jgi:hypothetical protein
MHPRILAGHWFETREDYPLGIQYIELWADPIKKDMKACIQTKDGEWGVINIKV